MSQVATSIRRGATPSADLQTAYLNLSHRTYVADDAAVTSGVDQLAASVNAVSASDPTGTAIQWTAPLPTPQAHPRRRPVDVSMPSTN